MTRVTESGTVTTDLTAAYGLDQLNISVESSLLTLVNVEHQVNVLAI